MQNLDFSKIRFVLLDIEGTVSDIHFVRHVLFPYSARELRNYVSAHRHHPEVKTALADLGSKDLETALTTLLQMIKDDVKHPSLKTLQGLIWKSGFEQGVFRSPLYPDVKPALDRWKAQGLSLGVFSSGSVAAQKLFFGHTEHGDLLPYFQFFFDLNVGSKKSPNSYSTIAATIQLKPAQVLFLSDLGDEVTAALSAGFNALQVVRAGTRPDPQLSTITSFTTL